MQPYKSDNMAPPVGLGLLLVTAIGGGLLLGGIVYFISQYVYLIILFPILMGVGIGYVVAVGVKVGKVRNAAIAALFGILAALALYGTYRYGEYAVGFKDDIREEWENLTNGQAEISDEEVDDIATFILEEETGSTGFYGFVKLQAKEGVTITHRRASSAGGFSLSGALAWIYWGIELLVIAGISALIALDQADKPFSREVNQWYSQDRYLGSVPLAEMGTLWNLLLNQQYEDAHKLMAQYERDFVPRADLYMTQTAQPSSEVVIKVAKITQNNKGEIKTDFTSDYGLLPENQVTRLQSGA